MQNLFELHFPLVKEVKGLVCSNANKVLEGGQECLERSTDNEIPND